MKSSQNCKRKDLTAAYAAAIGGMLVLLGMAAPAEPAWADTTTPQYQPWTGAAAQQMKNLIAELKGKIAAAEQAQAASPDFLADLKALVAKYEALQAAATGSTATGPAAGTVVFSDTFADGDYLTNPTWKVSAGSFTVDPVGFNHGLVTKIRPQQLNINTVLGQILQPQGSNQTGSTQSDYASIYSPVKIPNAFALKVALTSKDKQGALNLGIYQGASGTTLYRMVYQPGAAPGLAIQKVTPQGVTTLGADNAIVNLEDGQPHDLVLSRDAAGSMTLTLDGQTAATAKDTSIAGDMTGLLLINSGGAYWIREVKVIAN